MAVTIEKPRNGCALHGAVQTISEIGGVVPIIHANGGCSLQNYLANHASGLARGYVKGLSIPGTNFQERHIIFGGASRLREQIKNTLKVFEGELYVVLNSCESAMVGDDIEAMTREVQEQGEPVIENLSAGFHGDNHYGYESLLSDLFEKIPKVKNVEQKTNAKLVNILGIIPNQDIYFKGDLEEIKRILLGVGVKANTFFHARGVEELLTAQNASLNIVFSKWGIKAAETLKRLYGIDYVVYDSVPTGIEEVTEFVQKIGDKLELCYDLVDGFLEEEKEYFDYYLKRVSTDFYEGSLQTRLSVVGDEKQVRQIASFAQKYLGVSVDTIVVTDFYPGDDNPVEEKLNDLKDLADHVKFSQDGREIAGIIAKSNSSVISGSSLEKEAALKKNAALLENAYPVYGQTILNKSYAGTRGSITLAEEIIRIGKQIESRERQKILDAIGA